MEFRITSPAFHHGSQIPSKYTCDGENISPHLLIHGVPEGARSLALMVEDPDDPAGPSVLWLMWDIPPETREIREHSAPFGGVEGRNSWGDNGYEGPCPAAGTHRYFFRLFALDMRPKLPAHAMKEEVETAMAGHIVATAELMGTYARTNEAPV